MKKLAGMLASLSIVAFVVMGTGCGDDDDGAAGTCTTEQSKACDDTFNTCIANAAASADLAACTACAKDICNCYDKCGSTCNEEEYANRCGG